MTVKTHITTSAIFAATIYYITSSLTASISAFLGGIFIDLDHLIDFLAFSGERFSIHTLFAWCDEKWEKSIFIFHSYELHIIFALIIYRYPHPVLSGISSGMVLHLLLDQIGNRYMLKKYSIRPLFYFFTFRLLKGFQKDLMLEDKVNI